MSEWPFEPVQQQIRKDQDTSNSDRGDHEHCAVPACRRTRQQVFRICESRERADRVPRSTAVHNCQHDCDRSHTRSIPTEYSVGRFTVTKPRKTALRGGPGLGVRKISSEHVDHGLHGGDHVEVRIEKPLVLEPFEGRDDQRGNLGGVDIFSCGPQFRASEGGRFEDVSDGLSTLSRPIGGVGFERADVCESNDGHAVAVCPNHLGEKVEHRHEIAARVVQSLGQQLEVLDVPGPEDSGKKALLAGEMMEQAGLGESRSSCHRCQ
ncbi:MAG: hypothetical protein K0Q46_905 [Rhodococcus erythropolis]|nr:hypothetical protein [Rhodococcus erythropolis]